jgi:HTH-type transcriptional regulator / antitoxin HigA
MDEDEFRTPGQLIHTLLEKRGWTQRVLAIILRTSESAINKIIAGKQPLDAPMALALGEVFGITAERFLDLQKQFELSQARIISRPDPKRATRAALFGDLPVTEMIKRGWLSAEDIRDTVNVEKSLVKFFHARALEEIEFLPHAAKKTYVSTEVTPAQMAWLYRVKELADEMLVAEYSTGSVLEAVRQLSALRGSPEQARKVPRIMTECGIRFVIVESLPGAQIDGVCLWLNDNSPVVGMSLRHDRIDNFWFVLRHELEHVIQEHGKSAAMLDSDLEGERAGTGVDISSEERIANEAAAEFCVPQAKLDAFIARKAPVFAERDILGFSQTLKIHPGIVSGQLQHRTSRYDRFRNHLVKIRSVIVPGATVDGWGDIAPVGE